MLMFDCKAQQQHNTQMVGGGLLASQVLQQLLMGISSKQCSLNSR
jgi:hypothetical protein